MERDEQQRAKIQGAYDVLKRRGSPVAVVKASERAWGPGAGGVDAADARAQSARGARCTLAPRLVPTLARQSSSRLVRHAPTRPLQSYPRKVYSTYFSDRSPLGISDSEPRSTAGLPACRCAGGGAWML